MLNNLKFGIKNKKYLPLLYPLLTSNSKLLFKTASKLFTFTDKKIDDNYFYDKSNVDNSITNKNLIQIKDSKMKSKLTITESLEQPLIENEAYRELYRNFSVYIGEETSKELDAITHNEEKNGKLHKFGLPVKNELVFSDLVPIEEVCELPKTATENLFESLQLDGESSYESLLLKFQSEFNHGIINFN